MTVLKPTDATFGHLHVFESNAAGTTRAGSREIEFMSRHGRKIVESLSRVCRADVEQM